MLLPYSRVIGVSARIEDEAERTRLKTLMAGLANGAGSGYIVRTNAEGQTAEALAEDIDYLSRAWRIIREASASTQSRAAASTRTCRCRCAPCAT